MSKGNGFFKSLSKNRSLRYGSNSIILIVAVVAIAVIANMLVGMADLKLDMTKEKLFSISDKTKQILTGLKTDVTVYGLFDEKKASTNESMKMLLELINQYKKFPHVKVVYRDPDKDPAIIKEIDPNGLKEIKLGDLVIKSGNKIKKLANEQLFYDPQGTGQASYLTAENAFTGAIKFVTAESTPTVYFLEGHEEVSLDENLRTIKSNLEMNNFEVKKINLLTQKSVPQDAQVLVVAAPKRDISQDEKEKIKAFFKNGGRAVFMFDPIESATPFPVFEELLKDFNVSLNYDVVKEGDDNRHVPQMEYDIVPELQSSEIYTLFDPQKFVMVLPKSRSINILKNAKESIVTASLAKSSAKSVGEQIDKSKGNNLKGPLDLIVAAENKGQKNPSRIVVMGNASFLTDSNVQQYQQVAYNGMYHFLNSVVWMQNQRDEVMIEPKSLSTEKLDITEAQVKIASAATVIVIPLIILAVGIFVWTRRRHL